MNEAGAALIGAAVGALAGVAGGALAALASLRASQLAARVHLAGKLRALAEAHVRATEALGKEDEKKRRDELEGAWHDLFVHQRVLCPSRRLEELGGFLLRVIRETKDTKAALSAAGQGSDIAARIVGAHCAHLFRWSAWQEERRIIEEWLESERARLLSDEMRTRLRERLLGARSQWWSLVERGFL